MSWSLSVNTGQPGDTESPARRVLDSVDGYLTSQEAPDFVREAVEQAAYAALEVLHSEVVGSPDRHSFVITLSGHANPDHKPTEGWVNDFVTINVTQTSEA